MRVLHRCARCKHSVTATDSVSVILCTAAGYDMKGGQERTDGKHDVSVYYLLL